MTAYIKAVHRLSPSAIMAHATGGRLQPGCGVRRCCSLFDINLSQQTSASTGGTERLAGLNPPGCASACMRKLRQNPRALPTQPRRRARARMTAGYRVPTSWRSIAPRYVVCQATGKRQSSRGSSSYIRSSPPMSGRSFVRLFERDPVSTAGADSRTFSFGAAAFGWHMGK